MNSFAAWRPDIYGPNKPFTDVATGCVPQSSSAGGIGYGPFPQLVTAAGADALPGAPRGGISLQKADLTWQVFYATATTIEALQSDYSWTEIENTRTVPTGKDVSFCYFGKYLLNSDTSDGYKAYDVDAGGTNSAVSGAPAAEFIFSANNVVFALAPSGSPRRFQSSDTGRHDRWTGGAANGKTFEDGGGLVCGADLKNGTAVLFQERAIRQVTFGAGVSTYSIAKIADGRGCVHARTMAAFDGQVFWFDVDGPWGMAAGGAPRPIGAEKITRWLEANIGVDNYGDLQAVIEPTRNLVLWRIDATRALAYNWLIQEFTILPVACAALTRISTPGVSVDSLVGTIDSLSSIIDNRDWAGNSPVLGALDASYKFATFTGSNMAASIRTGVLHAPLSRRIRRLTPISDNPASTITVGTSGSLSGAISWGSASARVSNGTVPLDERGLVAVYQEDHAAGDVWTYANGVDHIEERYGGKS